MAFTTEDLKDLFRTEMEDTEEDFLFSDDQVYEFMNEAQREFARRTKIFVSERSGIVVTADDPLIDVPSTAFKLRRAQLETQGRPLQLINFIDMDFSFVTDDYGSEQLGDWPNAVGLPKLLISDMIKDKYRLAPIPQIDNTLLLHTTDYPATDIEDDGSEFSLTETRHQRSLILYMRHLAYNIHDAETFNPDLSGDFKGAWEERLSIFIEELRNERRRGTGTVHYGGIF